MNVWTNITVSNLRTLETICLWAALHWPVRESTRDLFHWKHRKHVRFSTMKGENIWNVDMHKIIVRWRCHVIQTMNVKRVFPTGVSFFVRPRAHGDNVQKQRKRCTSKDLHKWWWLRDRGDVSKLHNKEADVLFVLQLFENLPSLQAR